MHRCAQGILALTLLASACAATVPVCGVNATINFRGTQCTSTCQSSPDTHRAIAQYALNATLALSAVPTLTNGNLVITWTFAADGAAWCAADYQQWAVLGEAIGQATWGGLRWVDKLVSFVFTMHQAPPLPLPLLPPPLDVPAPRPAPIIRPPAASPPPTPTPSPLPVNSYSYVLFAVLAAAVVALTCGCYFCTRGGDSGEQVTQAEHDVAASHQQPRSRKQLHAAYHQTTRRNRWRM